MTSTAAAPTTSQTATASMIETHGLAKTFQSGRKAVQAVRGVDLDVRAGEIFGFLGPNGAGKTTTMRMLTTLLPPTGGQATVAGYDLRRDAKNVRRRIGYVSQQGGSEPLETGRENLMMQGRVYGMSRSEARQRTEDLLNTLEMSTFADRIVKTYSGGQKRRLDVALGIMHRPQLLFLDEPTTGLDPQSRARIWEEVRRLHEGGMTIFLTTHYMDEADNLCDRLAIIDNGAIVSLDTPNALKRQIAGDIISLGLDAADAERVATALRTESFVRELDPTDQGLRLYVDGGDEVLPQVLRLLDQQRIPVHTVTLARPTLEDVFLRQTGRSLRESA